MRRPSNRTWGALALCGILAGMVRADTWWYDDVAQARGLRADGTGPVEWRQAANLLDQALRKDVPEARRAEVLFLLGCAAYDLGEAPRAVAALREALALEPAVPLYRLWLGYAYDLEGRSTLAVQCLRRVHRDPRAASEQRASAAQWLEQLHEPVELAAIEPDVRTAVPGALLYHRSGEPAVAAVRDALTAARTELRRVVGIELEEPVEVFVFGSEAEYRRYHERRGSPRPEWSTACSANGRIYTFGAVGDRDGFRATLMHEYAHVACRAAAGDRTLPCWIDEGLAVLLAGQFPNHRSDLRAARQLLGLETLMAPTFSILNRDDAYLAYAESKAMVSELLRWRGPAALRGFFEHLGASGDAEAAFHAAFGSTIGEFFDWFVTERIDAL